MHPLLRLLDRVRDAGRRRRWNAAQALGRRGEDIAHRRLQREGYTVVARNYRPIGGGGEVDIVAWEAETLVFVEVKTRASQEFGAPERAIGEEKRRAMRRAAERYARAAGVEVERVRFDVVSIVMSSPPAVEILRDAYPRWGPVS